MLRKYIGNKEFYRRVIIITLPILIQNVITNFVSFIDNMMVGQIGTEQMSGVAIVNQLIFVFNLCVFGGVSGAGIFTAQFFGKGDNKGVRDTFRAKIAIVSVISVAFVVGFYFFGTELISLFLHEGEDALDLNAALKFGERYLLIMLIQIPLFALSQAYSGTLREIGYTVLPMVSGVVAVVVNVGLNYALIFGKLGFPELGIEGAAIATVIARFFETFIVMIWTHTHRKKYKFIKGAYRSLKIPGALLLNIFKKGFPLMLNEVLWALGMTMLAQCYSVRGLEAVSAQNIASTVSNVFFCGFFAFGSAISIIVGQHLGAGDLERAVDEDRKLIFGAVVVCFFIGGLMAALSSLFPQIYNTTDTVKSIATSMLLISSMLMPVNAFVHTAYFTLRCGGKTLVTFLFDSMFVWCVATPVAFVLSRFTDMNVVMLYAIVQGLDIIKCVVGYILVRKRVWVNDLVGGDKTAKAEA